MSIDIPVEERNVEELEQVNLGTSSYEFSYPKVSPLLNAQQKALTLPDGEKAEIIVSSQNRWLEIGFGPQQWAHIQARLNDEADPLDFSHIQTLFQALFEKAVQNRPPTWRGDSSKVSPQAFRRAVEQNPLGSMSDPSQLLDSVTS